MQSNRWFRKKRVWAFFALLALLATILSFPGTRLLLQQAPLSPRETAPLPQVSMEDLPAYADSLQKNMYGPILPFDITANDPVRLIADHRFSDSMTIEEYRINGTFGAVEQTFHMVLLTPKGDGPFPIILSQNFCPNHNVIPDMGLSVPDGDYYDCGGDGMVANFFQYFFGRYITTPPIEKIARSGYALAVLYPNELVPDSRADGLTRLSKLFPQLDAHDRPGALSAWASQLIAVAKFVKIDPRFNQRIAYGHSRYGKTALMAAAFSDEIDGVIAHQSGTGGASSLKDDVGESVDAITTAYPHWFSPKFAKYAGLENELPVEAYMLLSLIAPRPVLLGNARRDVWSDPNGAFTAARATSAAYEHYDVTGLEQIRLNAFNPNANLSFWMRPGTHGVVEEDWPTFLQFLDAHFQ